jgi:hypothetical protein
VSEDLPSPAAPARSGPPSRVSAPTGLRIACTLIGLQALGLVVAAAVLLIQTLTGHPTDRASALLGAAFAVAAAAAFGFGARGLLQLRPAARTPIVVLEVLTVPVAYSLAFDSGRYAYGAPILLVALVVLYLLFTPPVRAVLDREDPVR